jgi:hypothetical protein
MKPLLVLWLTVVAGISATTVTALGQTPYSYNCASDRVLIGVRGWQGMWMDGAQAICAKIRSDGTINSSDVVYTTRAGGTGGWGTTSGTYRCPSGQVLTGFVGGRGSYVNTIRTLDCQPFDAGRRISVDPIGFVTAFAQKSGTYLTDLCQYGMVARGISGKAGIYLDTFGLECGYVSGAERPTYGGGTRSTDQPKIICTPRPENNYCRR